MNARTSVLPTVVARVGVDPLGNFTETGHVAVYDPLPPCTKNNVKLEVRPEDAGFMKLKVVLPVSVNANSFASDISILYVPETLALTMVVSRYAVIVGVVRVAVYPT